MADWRDIEDERERYAAYLCSREWGVLKEAVRERSGGMCERCGKHDMRDVHHKTYIRKYAERLEDLQAICKWCHDFTHGRGDVDPAAPVAEPTTLTSRHSRWMRDPLWYSHDGFGAVCEAILSLEARGVRPTPRRIVQAAKEHGSLARMASSEEAALDFLVNTVRIPDYEAMVESGDLPAESLNENHEFAATWLLQTLRQRETEYRAGRRL